MNKKRLAILGAGALGKQILNIAKQTNQFEFVGFFDDYNSGKDIIGKSDKILQYNSSRFDELIVGIGYKHLVERERFYNDLLNEISFATVIHPSCLIDPSAIIGKGCVLYPGCIIDECVNISPNNVINLGTIISHECSIGFSNFISPGAVLCGCVQLGNCNFIGASTTIIDHIIIGNNNHIGAGSLISKNHGHNLKIKGVPAKPY